MSLYKQRALIIHADILIAAMVQKYLSKRGYATTISHTAQQALQKADDTSPDVIILDIELPRHSGVEFLYEFYSYPEWQHIPVIVLSSLHATPEVLGKAFLQRGRRVQLVDFYRDGVAGLAAALHAASPVPV